MTATNAPWTTAPGPVAQQPVLGPIDQLVVPYATARIHEEMRRRKGVVFARGVGMALSLLILAGLQLWRALKHISSPVFTWPYWVAFGVSMAVSGALLALGIVAWRRAVGKAAMITPAPALVISRSVIHVADTDILWSDLAGLQAKTRRFGRGDVFVVHRQSGAPVTIWFDLLDVAPSALDSAARAFSAGRIGVDFSRMDN